MVKFLSLSGLEELFSRCFFLNLTNDGGSYTMDRKLLFCACEFTDEGLISVQGDSTGFRLETLPEGFKGA